MKSGEAIKSSSHTDEELSEAGITDEQRKLWDKLGEDIVQLVSDFEDEADLLVTGLDLRRAVSACPCGKCGVIGLSVQVQAPRPVVLDDLLDRAVDNSVSN